MHNIHALFTHHTHKRADGREGRPAARPRSIEVRQPHCANAFSYWTRFGQDNDVMAALVHRTSQLHGIDRRPSDSHRKRVDENPHPA
jgi:hypothetical protein